MPVCVFHAFFNVPVPTALRSLSQCMHSLPSRPHDCGMHNPRDSWRSITRTPRMCMSASLVATAQIWPLRKKPVSKSSASPADTFTPCPLDRRDTTTVRTKPAVIRSDFRASALRAFSSLSSLSGGADLFILVRMRYMAASDSRSSAYVLHRKSHRHRAFRAFSFWSSLY